MSGQSGRWSNGSESDRRRFPMKSLPLVAVSKDLIWKEYSLRGRKELEHVHSRSSNSASALLVKVQVKNC